MVVAGLKAGGSRCCTIGLSLVKRRCCLAGAASAVFSWNKRSDEVLKEAEDSAISGLLLEAHDACCTIAGVEEELAQTPVQRGSLLTCWADQSCWSA